MKESSNAIKLSEIHPNTKGNPELILMRVKETRGHVWYKNPYNNNVIRVKKY